MNCATCTSPATVVIHHRGIGGKLLLPERIDACSECSPMIKASAQAQGVVLCVPSSLVELHTSVPRRMRPAREVVRFVAPPVVEDPPKPARRRDRRYKNGRWAKAVGEVRFNLLGVAVTGRRSEWLAVYVGRPARTQAALMVGLGWIDKDGAITEEGREVYLDELDRRALAAAQGVGR
jgi:hypothetical protein